MLSLVLLLVGCGGNPARDAAVTYAHAMSPVLARNTALGEQLVDASTRLGQQQLAPADVAARFTTVAVPGAADVASQAASVHPAGPELTVAHSALVNAWQERAAGYSAAAAAWSAGDTAGFEAARLRIVSANAKAAAAIDSVNAQTRPVGVDIQLYGEPFITSP